jgi:hypothetical protein
MVGDGQNCAVIQQFNNSQFTIQTRPDSREPGERRGDFHPAAANTKMFAF